MTIGMKTLFLILTLCGANFNIASAALDGAKIDNLTGLKGKWNAQEGVYKVTFPRNDVKIAIDGWPMPPFMGLGTWAAFEARTPLRRWQCVVSFTAWVTDTGCMWQCFQGSQT